MAFFDKLKESALAAAEQTKVIAKSVGEKAEAAMEIQKLNTAIEKQKQIISNNYKKIGAYVYENFKSEESVPPKLEPIFAELEAANAEIDHLNKQITLIKMERFGGPAPTICCPKCQALIAETAKFCPECGTPLEKEDVKEETETSETSASDLKDANISEVTDNNVRKEKDSSEEEKPKE